MASRCSRSVLFLLLHTMSALCGRPCAIKKFGADLIACVCNSTYCDTIDPIPQLSRGQFVRYTSDISGLRLHQTTGQFSARTSYEYLRMTVRDNKRYQTILGFGTSFTDSSGINVNSLGKDTQENLLRSYFSVDGIECNFGRVPIGGSDFSTHPYAYDDVKGDENLLFFNLTTEDYNLKIPLIKRALGMSQRQISLLGAAWSPPPWMKTNKEYTGLGLLSAEYYQTWALYHVKFLDAYAREGINFWSISTGNEPFNGLTTGVVFFNNLGWIAKDQMTWIEENLGPTLRASPHADVTIHTADDQRSTLTWWMIAMKANERAAQYVEGIAFHWYLNHIASPWLLDFVHHSFPGKFLLSTEACEGYARYHFRKVILGSWARGESYMTDIFEDLNHWVAGWIDWNLALDMIGGPNWVNNFVDSSIIVNAIADEFYKQPTFYALGHFSKFIPEGSVRVAITPNSLFGVQSMAFRTPQDTTVIVLHNRKNFDAKLTITDPDRGHINLLLSRRSFTTIVYE